MNLFHKYFRVGKQYIKRKHIEEFLKLDSFDANAQVGEDKKQGIYFEFVENAVECEDYIARDPEILKLFIAKGLDLKSKSRDGESLLCFCHRICGY